MTAKEELLELIMAYPEQSHYIREILFLVSGYQFALTEPALTAAKKSGKM